MDEYTVEDEMKTTENKSERAERKWWERIEEEEETYTH